MPSECTTVSVSSSSLINSPRFSGRCVVVFYHSFVWFMMQKVCVLFVAQVEQNRLLQRLPPSPEPVSSPLQDVFSCLGQGGGHDTQESPVADIQRPSDSLCEPQCCPFSNERLQAPWWSSLVHLNFRIARTNLSLPLPATLHAVWLVYHALSHANQLARLAFCFLLHVFPISQELSPGHLMEGGRTVEGAQASGIQRCIDPPAIVL